MRPGLRRKKVKALEALILAGGLGRRLRTVVSDVPKPMAPINGRPFLGYILDQLTKSDFKKIYISVGYLADSVIEKFRYNYNGLEIEYVRENEALGTGGAISKGLQRCSEEWVFVMNGDTYLEPDYVSMLDFARAADKPIILGANLLDVSRYGVLVTKRGGLVSFGEKSASGPGKINAGLYCLPRNLHTPQSASHPFSFEKDWLPYLIKEYGVGVLEYSGLFIDIGVPEDLEKARNLFAMQSKAHKPDARQK